MTNKWRTVAFVLGIATLGFQSPFALQIKVTERELISKSDYIVVGKVVDKNCYWNPEMNLIYTDYVVKVDNYVKGDTNFSKITIKVLGGEIGGVGLIVTGQPHFEQGERTLLYLKKGEEGKMRVVYGNQGKYTVYGGVIQESGEDIKLYRERVTKIIQKQTGRGGLR
jgi:hypothetical protein